MAFFKGTAIKWETRKCTRQLCKLILDDLPENINQTNFEKEFKDAIINFIDFKCAITGMHFQFPFDIKVSKPFPIFSVMVMQLVFSELSYDSSIGSDEDIRLVLATVTDETKKILQAWNIK